MSFWIPREWADYLDKLKVDVKVIPFSQKAVREGSRHDHDEKEDPRS
jgi:hypothetical protein